MPLFFIISGFFFKPKPLMISLKDNFKRLIIPYLFICCVWILCAFIIDTIQYNTIQ
jgi:fucose 4-O-acetylase-like acetyltransferase